MKLSKLEKCTHSKSLGLPPNRATTLQRVSVWLPVLWKVRRVLQAAFLEAERTKLVLC